MRWYLRHSSKTKKQNSSMQEITNFFAIKNLFRRFAKLQQSPSRCKILQFLTRSFLNYTTFKIFAIVFLAGNAHAVPNLYEIAISRPSDITLSENISLPDRAEFQTFENGTNYGFIEGDVWIIVNPLDVRQGDYLTIRPIHLDRVEVYTEDLNSIFLGGDTIPSRQDFLVGGYAIRIPEDQHGKELFIRISSNNVIQPFVGIEHPDELLKSSLDIYLMVAAASSISLFYLAWAISAALTRPTALTLSFAIRIISFVVTLVIHSGVLRQITSIEHLPTQDWLHNCSALVYITIAQIFDYFLLRQSVRKSASNVFLIVIFASALTKFGLFSINEVSAALQINNLTALATLLMGFSLAAASSNQSSRQKLNSTTPIGRSLLILYFLLQAIPLILLLYFVFFPGGQYPKYADLAFLNYAIVPGGFVVYILAKHQRDYVRQSEELQKNADSLQLEKQAEMKKREEISDMLNMLAHEIKTPLATLQMAQAVDKVDAFILAKATRAIKNAVTQAESIEEIKGGPSNLEISVIDLCSVVRQAADDSYGEVSIDCNNEYISVTTDPRLLQIILGNLIANSIKYSSPGSIPAIKVITLKEDVIVCVMNEISAPLQSIDRITEKYYRDPAAKGSSGTGLGLYIVKKLCDQIGHAFEVKATNTEFSAMIIIKKSSCSVL